MKRFLILALLVGLFCPLAVNAQKPVPGPTPADSVVVDDDDAAMFFAGASDVDKAVVKQARKAIMASDMSFREKARCFRLLMQKRFVDDLKQQAIDDAAWGDTTTPEQMELVVGGKWLDFFNNIDLEKWIAFIKILIDLFASNGGNASFDWSVMTC